MTSHDLVASTGPVSVASFARLGACRVLCGGALEHLLPAISPLTGLAVGTLATLFIAWLSALSAPLKELTLQVHGQRVRLRRTLRNGQLLLPGQRRWRTIRFPYEHDGLVADWPDVRGDGLLRWRDAEAVGGRATPVTLGLDSFFVTTTLGLAALTTVAVLGNTTRFPVFDASTSTVTGRRWLVSGFVLAEPPPVLSCPITVTRQQPTVQLGGQGLVVDLGAQMLTWFGAWAPLPREQLGSFHGPLAPSLSGFGTADAPALQGLFVRGLDLCGHPLPEQRAWVAPITPPGDAFRGMLGLGTLGARVVELDLAALRLRLVDAVSDLDHPWLATPPLQLIDDHHVHLNATYAGRPIRVQIDTGAYHSSAAPGLSGLLPPIEGRTERITLTGGSHGVQGVAGTRRLSRLAPFCLDAAGTVCIDSLLVDEDAPDVDLNLGTDALWGRILVLDLQQRHLWISPTREVPEEARDAVEQRDWHESLRKALQAWDAGREDTKKQR